MGTQTGWQPDWGWGELNMASAFVQRANTNGGADEVGPQDVRFYRSTVSAGDRATLVWNRRSTGCFTAGCGSPHAMTLSNLDLSEYESGGALRASSTSSIDNVEQVMAPSTGTVVYKVKDESSTIDGLPAEPFAFVATDPITPLAAPKPLVSLRLDRPAAKQGEPVTVTADLANSSPDLTGSNTQVSLSVPAGIQVTAGGSTTWTPGDLAAGGSASHQWTVKGTSDALARLAATAQDEAYGEIFTSRTADATLDVDSTPPATTISCPRGQSVDPALTVSWSAIDTSNIARFDIDLSTDGGPFLPWLPGATQTAATFSGQIGHTYRFAVRATDALGNQSEPAACDAVAVVEPTRAPVLPPPPTVGTQLPSPPHLKLASASVGTTKLVASGTLVAGATGTVRGSYTSGGRAVRGSAVVRSGRFRLTLRLGRSLRGTRGGVLRLSYSGDATHSAQHLTRHVRR
jgi:hypothetical protein